MSYRTKLSNTSASANNYATGTNANAVVTLAAALNGHNAITGVAFSYGAAPTGGNLTITDAGTTVFSVDITAAGPGFIPFPYPLQNAAVNSALVITLAAGGSGIVGRVNVLGATISAV